MAGKITRILGKLISTNTFNASTCIPDTLEKLVDELTKRLNIEIPSQDTDTFVTISVTAPTDKTKLWLATDTSGTVISLRKFVADSWQEILPVGLNMLLPFYGDPVSFNMSGWLAADGTNGTPNTQAAWVNIGGGDKLFYGVYVGK